MKYQIGLGENAVSTVAIVYSTKVMMKSFLRPNRSVSWPNTSAPRQAPAT